MKIIIFIQPSLFLVRLCNVIKRIKNILLLLFSVLISLSKLIYSQDVICAGSSYNHEILETVYLTGCCSHCGGTSWDITGPSYVVGGVVYTGTNGFSLGIGVDLEIEFLIAGAYTVECVLQNTICGAGPCQLNTTTWIGTINVTPPVITKDICKGDSVTLNSTCTSGVVRWTKVTCSNIYIATAPTIKVSPLDTTSYFYKCGTSPFNEIKVNVIPLFRDTVYDTICKGESVLYAGSNRLQAGFYDDTLTSVDGCDSITNLDLIVANDFNDTIISSICDGGSVFFAGVNRTGSGFYRDTLTSVDGCDSITNLDLIVFLTYNDTLYMELCEDNVPLIAGTILIDTAGFYRDTLVAINSCDSIINIDVTINELFHEILDTTICEGDSIFYDRNYFKETTFQSVIHTNNGAIFCDSTWTLDLKVTPRVRDTIYNSLCNNDSMFFGSKYINLEGVYYDTNARVKGCDSITVLNLSLYDEYKVNIIGDTVLCKYEEGNLFFNELYSSYLWNTGDQTSSLKVIYPGLYFVSVLDENNCISQDSILLNSINCNDSCQIYVPNTFTPNNDALNEYLEVISTQGCELSYYELLIFNRWGQLLYKSNNIDKKWNGIYKNVLSQKDTYIWRIKYQFNGKVEIEEKRGHINIIK
jgi:gliding motility-associated-like protein